MPAPPAAHPVQPCSRGANTLPGPLLNPSFEGPYLPVSDGAAQITGVVASGWQDNSAWAGVSVQYAQETTNPHSGASCRKITLTSVPSGELQLIQGFELQSGSLYTASFWVRGSAPTQAIVRIQQDSAPAPVRSILVVYLTGIGTLTTTLGDGQPAPASSLAEAALPASATIGGVNAPIEFLGLTPGYVGLGQANIQVPKLAPGDYPLIITVNGRASAAALVSVSAE